MNVQPAMFLVISLNVFSFSPILTFFPLGHAQRAFRKWRDRCRERNHWPSDDNPLHRKHWMTYMPGVTTDE